MTECKHYIAFLDILGFRELIMNNTDETVNSILHKVFKDTIVSTFASIYKDEVFLGVIPNKPNIQVVSDSIILWVKAQDFRDFYILTLFTSILMYNAVREGIPLRGSIVKNSFYEYKLVDLVGEINLVQPNINTQSSILFGKGIVQAYSLEGTQNWSGCIIDDSCTIMNPTDKKILDIIVHDNLTVARYDVPIKSNECRKMLAVNWPCSLMGNLT